MGIHTLGQLMPKISKAGGLSKVYTNHCIRATAVTVLSNSGVDDMDIISVSGHKNVQSLLPYKQSVSDEKRKCMSSTLALFGKKLSEPDENKENMHESSVEIASKSYSETVSGTILKGNTFNASNIVVNVNVHN